MCKASDLGEFLLLERPMQPQSKVRNDHSNAIADNGCLDTPLLCSLRESFKPVCIFNHHMASSLQIYASIEGFNVPHIAASQFSQTHLSMGCLQSSQSLTLLAVRLVPVLLCPVDIFVLRRAAH